VRRERAVRTNWRKDETRQSGKKEVLHRPEKDEGKGEAKSWKFIQARGSVPFPEISCNEPAGAGTFLIQTNLGSSEGRGVCESQGI